MTEGSLPTCESSAPQREPVTEWRSWLGPRATTCSPSARSNAAGSAAWPAARCAAARRAASRVSSTSSRRTASGAAPACRSCRSPSCGADTRHERTTCSLQRLCTCDPAAGASRLRERTAQASASGEVTRARGVPGLGPSRRRPLAGEEHRGNRLGGQSAMYPRVPARRSLDLESGSQRDPKIGSPQ